MNSTWELIKLRGLFIRNQFARPTRSKKNRWAMIGGFTTLFIWLDYLFFMRMIRYLDGLPMNIGDELIVQLINVVFLTLFAMVLFSSVIASLSIFYASVDLELLHSLPIKTGAIINAQLLQTVLNASWMMGVFALPIFIAYGNYFNVDLGFYGYLIISFIPFVVLPTVLGVLGIMVLMRYFPTERAHQVLSFFGLFFLVSLVLFLRFLSPEKFFGQKVSDDMIISFVDSLKVPEFPFLPSSWITRGLTAWVDGDTETAWMRLLYLIGALTVMVVVFKIISSRIYYPGWRMFQEIRNAEKKNETVKGDFSWLNWLPWSAQRRALLIKDLRVFSRDPSQWSQMFILMALVIVYIFNIMNLPLENVVLKNVVSVLNIGLVGFVLSAIISRFGFTATSVEGTRMWSVYTAPVNMKQFLWGKFWLYLPPLLLMGEALVIVSNYLLEVDAYVMKVSIIGVFFISLGLVGMGVGMGAMYPMFRHQNVSEISSGMGGILFMVSSLAYVGVVLILGAWPMHVHFKAKFAFEFIDGSSIPMIYALIVFLSIYVTLEPLRRGVQNLRNMDF